MNAQTAAKAEEFDPTVWIELYGDYLFALACSRVRCRTTAEEMVRETLLAAIRDRRSFAEKSAERSWLAGILRHRMIEYFRRLSRAQSDSSPDETDLASYRYLFADETWKDHWTAERMPSNWQTTPARELGNGEFCAVLERCLGELPARVASAFTLRELEGFEAGEICDILNISVDNYAALLHRARTHLRRCLDDDWFRKIHA